VGAEAEVPAIGMGLPWYQIWKLSPMAATSGKPCEVLVREESRRHNGDLLPVLC
jgi:hypothetical protein